MTNPVPAAKPDVTLRGRFDPAEVQVYRYVPFVVPAGISQLHIELSYNDQIDSSPMLSGGNTLDIGLFDERGSHSGSPGFRGWSGSNKRSITVGETWATPPYRPGKIGAGKWQVLLGPYKIGPNGLQYAVDIWFDPKRPEPAFAGDPVPFSKRSSLPEPIESGWLRGDLHTHSVASDGDSTLLELLQAARDAGLDFLGSTDHNAAVLPHLASPDPSLPVLVPGIEVTTYKGHWNVWGADRWFDFRLPAGDAVKEEMRIAETAGGVIAMNHPKPFGPPWEYGFDLGYHAVEVWNGPWPVLNATSLGVWDLHLALGKRVVAICGSDTHYLRGEDAGSMSRARLGQPTLWVKPEEPVSAASILAEVRAGRSFISAGPEGPQLLVKVAVPQAIQVRTRSANGLTLQLISAGKSVAAAAVDRDDWEREFAIPARIAHVRVQLVDACGNVEALSNAFWLD